MNVLARHMGHTSCCFAPFWLLIHNIGFCYAGQDNDSNNSGSAWGTALGVAAPCLGVMVWLAVTYTYRTEKHALVAGVLHRLTPIDIADEPPPSIKESTKENPSQPRRVERDDSVSDLIVPAHREAAPTPSMLKVAKEMTHRCLRRWDSVLALRASTDSQGMGQGIWRARYEGVRASVMLLAIHNLNRRLQETAVVPHDGEPGEQMYRRPAHAIKPCVYISVYVYVHIPATTAAVIPSLVTELWTLPGSKMPEQHNCFRTGIYMIVH